MFGFEHEKQLRQILENTETIMSTTASGLAALQTFTNTTFPAFVTQQSTDLASLTTSINNAISALQNSGASEDPAVASAVTSLTAALGTVEANETSLEALNTALTGALPVTATASASVKK
jgi:hypothetical protein